MGATLPDGTVLADLGIAQPWPNYGDNIDNNFDAVAAILSQQNAALQGLQNTNVASQADAVNAIPNLLANGEFMLSTCAPHDPQDTTLRDNIYYNSAHDTYMVPWADCWWFYDADNTDRLIEPTSVDMDLASGSQPGYLGGIRVDRGGGSAAGTLPYSDGRAFLFQPMDLFFDVRRLRSRTLTFAILYSADADDSLYLEVIDDSAPAGTTNESVARPAGTNVQQRVTHVVGATATRLMVRIHIRRTTGVAATETTVHKAVVRAGSSNFTIGSNTPVSYLPWDAAAALACHWQREVAPLVMGGSFASATVEEARGSWKLPVPLGVRSNQNELVLHSEFSDTADARRLSQLGTAPAFAAAGWRRALRADYAPSPLGTAGIDQEAATEVTYYLVRDTGSDPDPAPANGFQADSLRVYLNVIPAETV